MSINDSMEKYLEWKVKFIKNIDDFEVFLFIGNCFPRMIIITWIQSFDMIFWKKSAIKTFHTGNHFDESHTC